MRGQRKKKLVLDKDRIGISPTSMDNKRHKRITVVVKKSAIQMSGKRYKYIVKLIECEG